MTDPDLADDLDPDAAAHADGADDVLEIEPEGGLQSDDRSDNDEALVTAARDYIERGDREGLMALVDDLRGADMADLISHLPDEAGRLLFQWLPEAETAEALPEMESAERADLLEDVSTPDLVALLDLLDTDDAADVLADVAHDRADSVLEQLEDSADVSALLSYAEDTAGGLMGTEYVAVPVDATIAEATEAVRAQVEADDPVYVVYAVDDDGRLIGVVPLKRLLLARVGVLVGEVATTEPVSVLADLDQEEVARVMERYDLVALPVVSESGRLLGRITIDDVVDVIREEAEEDLQRAVGITGDEELSSSVFAVSRGRLVWLLLGLAGAYVSGLVIVGFDDALRVAPVLALFIPIVMAMAGNAGIQSSAIAVQGIASGDLWRSDLLKRVGKELAVALINGVVLAVALSIIVLLSGFGTDTGRLALTAGIALMIVIVLATLIGATVPLVLDRVGIDPALAMGPFITVSNDILGLTIFFVVATLLYL